MQTAIPVMLVLLYFRIHQSRLPLLNIPSVCFLKIALARIEGDILTLVLQ